MPETQDKIAAEIKEQKNASYEWMDSNFYPGWKRAFKSYKCLRDAYTDPNEVQPAESSGLYDAQGRNTYSTKVDTTRTSIGMPDTWALTRRIVARVTAQIPSLKFRARSFDRADRVSRRLMYQWDRGGAQRTQKKHATQAVLFGWSPRAWSWVEENFSRTKRVAPFDLQYRDQIISEYMDDIKEIVGSDKDLAMDLQEAGFDQVYPSIAAQLAAVRGRGGRLPIQYNYTGFVGPKAEFLFVGDCYPEPNFQSIQTSNWFIVERRRKRDWMEGTMKWAADNEYTDLANGIARLMKEQPYGTKRTKYGTDTESLRHMINGETGKSETDTGVAERKMDAEWVITERHIPGTDSKLAYSCENIFLGEIAYPYELEGRIAFTELVLIDSLMDGIGESHARTISGLQELHDRNVSQRSDLIYNLLRPIMWTTSRKLYDNPELIKRHKGHRLVHTDGPNDLGIVGEQSALAAAASGLNDESSILRLIQMASGESNMSMQANVDPQQARTATGARIMAYNQDILSRDMVDMFNQALREDAWMMYLLNRSEMTEPAEFDGAPYMRGPEAKDNPGEKWEDVTPEDFQVDGEIDVELGSTLADDDDARIARAQTLMSMAMSSPQLYNMETVRDHTLKTLGIAPQELQNWAAPQQGPPPPEEPRVSFTVSIKFDELEEPIQQMLLQKANLVPDQQPPPGPGGPPPMSPTSAMPDLSMDSQEVSATDAYAASRGQLPPRVE